MKFNFGCFLIVLSLIVSSCSQSVSTYTIDASVKDKIGFDSVYLYVYQQSQNKLLLANSAKVNTSRFRMTGNINDSQVAFLRFKNDTIPYYFILDSTPIELAITKNSYVIKGGEENNAYFKYLLRRQNIINEKKSLWAKYMSLAADSTLTDSTEMILKKKNDILIDSLSKMTKHYIELNTPISVLVKTQFGNY